MITPRHNLLWHLFKVCSGDQPTSLMQNCAILFKSWIRGVGEWISRVFDGSWWDQEVGGFKNHSNAVSEGKLESINLWARVSSRLQSRPCLLCLTSSLILLFKSPQYPCHLRWSIDLQLAISESPNPLCAMASKVAAPNPWTPLSRSLLAKSEYKTRPPVVSLSSSSMMSA